MDRLRHGGLAVLLLALGGCYRFVPLATPQPESGTYIAASLTDSGTLELARYLGPNVANLGGRLAGSTPEQLQIAVMTVEARDGQESFWKGEMVIVPRQLVAGMQERKFSGSRSALVAGLGLTAGIGLLRAFGVITLGSTGGGGSTANK